ncbi:Stk1 family PASTA domain-containing Ser/Thr kinase [Sinomonas cellulolyticus]|uniref:non-specific serine/threonine protein kinase n=1 Tax=Sinomonas cellulolyticus TaxID=2801916 RepID=A0ABS1K676_9MICC|nr:MULTISPECIES: Stk1 family PASTA domain-containing Ser/Thr kinase [Sinomonas]MBL0706978.1 Stk1 family PASTA domain-containing Ser/Thr kinase [Sinomonas cellulolyticus]
MPAPIVLSGRYELGELIGRGGMADVFEGRDLRLGRAVAVKMLRPDMARDGQFRARFEREARAVAGLNHPAIVAVFDTGEHNAEPLSPHSVAVPYIIMELVTGKTLREVIREGGVTVDEAVDYVLGVLSALEYSHRQGVIHRDIKPANVMLCSTPGEVKVMDFGIARATADSAATMTQTQAVVGTAQYLSPEQAQGEVVDARSDLYSAGCLLYELLTGRPPFIGESPVSLALQHVRSAAPPASEFNPAVTDALQSVIDRALEKDPNDRFPSAAAFQRALRAARAGVALPPRRSTDAVSAGDDGAPTEAVGLLAAGAAAAGAAGAAGGAAGAAGRAGLAGAAEPDAEAGKQTADGDRPASSHLGDTGEIPLVAAAAPGLIEFDDARDDERERRRRGRRRTWIVALIIAALLLATGGGILLYTYMNQPAAVQMIEVPSVANMSETEAALKLQGLGLQPSIDRPKDATVPKGKAIRTVPDAGTRLAPGSSISLQISDGPASATIPDSIIGATEIGARSALEGLGLKVKAKSVLANDPKAPRGTVTATNPGVGQTVAIGSEVELTVSTGKVDVPDVRGKSLDAAQKALSDLGLTTTVQQQDNAVVAPGTVTDQSPASPGTVDQGGTVVLTVAQAPPPPPPAPSPTTQTQAPSPSPTKKDNGKGNG